MASENQTSDRELRVIAKPVELRAVKGDDGGDVFSGYVFEWDTLSEDLGGWRETVRRGAASKCLASPSRNLFAVLDHDKEVAKVLGDTASGTLSVFEDDRGLGFVIHAGPTTAAKDAAIVAQRNRIGVSFAFVCGKQNWSTQEDGTRLREILEFRELIDLALVVDAAYKSSDVTVARRSLAAHLEQEQRDAPDQSAATVDPVATLQNLLALLRALHWLYHTAHWQASGPNFYGQRLMFERLYEALPDDFDALAEKMVAEFGEPSVNPVPVMAQALAYLTKWTVPGDVEFAAYRGAEDMQAAIQATYAALKGSGQLSAGMDDYLLALANDHDTDCYLLGQASKQLPPSEPTADYLLRCLQLAEMGVPVESRANEHHDENGKFHGKAPSAMLAAARGRMLKAEARHERAAESYRATAATKGMDHADSGSAMASWVDARSSHGASCDSAERCLVDAARAYEARCNEYRDAIAASRAKLTALVERPHDAAPVPANLNVT